MRIVLAAIVAGALAAGLAAQGAPGAEEARILEADRAFNQAVADRNVARFLALVAADATFAGGAAPLRGRDAVRDGWSRYFEADGPTLRWTPLRAQVLVGRDVGVTTGTWVLRSRGQDGRIDEARGEYLTVWRKEPDGVWRAVFDTGSAQPAADARQ